MSALHPESANQTGDAYNKPHWPPRTTDELWDVFSDREGIELFQGFSRNALAIKVAIEKTAENLRQGEKLTTYLPLEAGTDGRKVYKTDMTEAHIELIEAAYALTGAEPRTSEITEESPLGRAWFQGSYLDSATAKVYPMNFIEIHSQDSGGEYLKWQLVTDIPEEMLALNEAPTETKPWLTREDKVDIAEQALAEIHQLIGDNLTDEPYPKAA